MLSDIKQLSQHELLSKSVIYRELEDLFKPDDKEADIMRIINICFSVYLKKDYATLIGVAQSAREYILTIQENSGSLKEFNYETLFYDYHGVGEWY